MGQIHEPGGDIANLPTALAHVFIAYRQEDGLEAAEWLHGKLDGRHIHFERSPESVQIMTYYDQASPAIGDWLSYWRPKLEVSRALVFVATEAAAERRTGIDRLHEELDFWIANKGEAPIIIDATGDGARNVPAKITERWPNAQRVVLTPRLWEEDVRDRREQRALDRIVEGIRLSEEGIYFEELERLRSLNESLEQETARAEVNEQQAVTAQVSLSTRNGEAAIGDGNFWAAAVWFGEALRIDEARGFSEEDHRVRVASVLRRLPRLRHVWFDLDRNIDLLHFLTPERMVVVSEGVLLLDSTSGEQRVSLRGPDGWVSGLAVNSDGKVTAILERGNDGGGTVVATWDAASPRLAPVQLTGLDVTDVADSLALARVENSLRIVPLDGDQRTWSEDWAPPEGGWRFGSLLRDGSGVVAATDHQVWYRASSAGEQPQLLGEDVKATRLVVGQRSAGIVTRDAVFIWIDPSPDSRSRIDLKDTVPDFKEVIAVDFNPDGKHVLTTVTMAQGNRTSLVFDVSGTRGAVLKASIDHELPVERWEFNPPRQAGGRAAAASAMGAVRVNPFDKAAQFSPDGRMVVSHSKVDDSVRVWEWRHQKALTPPLSHFGERVGAFAFGTDSATLGVGFRDGTVRLWDISWPDRGGSPIKYPERVDSMSFAPDGQRLTLGGSSSSQIWSVDATGHSTTMPGSVLAFSPNGGLAVVVGERNGVSQRSFRLIEVVDVRNGEAVGPALEHPEAVREAVLPGRDVLFTYSSDRDDDRTRLWMWDIPAGNLLSDLQLEGRRIEAVDVLADHTLVALRVRTSYGFDGSEEERRRMNQPLVWDTAHGGVTQLGVSGAYGVEYLAFDGDTIWAYTDGVFEVFSHQGELTERYETASPFRRLLAVSHDGQRLASGRSETQAQIVDRRTGSPVTPQLEHQRRGSIVKAMFSHDGSRLLTISREQVRVWSAMNGALLAPPFVHDVRVNDAVLDPRGSSVAISTYSHKNSMTRSPGSVHRWSFQRDYRPVDLICFEAEVASGHHIDAAGGYVPFGRPAYRERWQALIAEYGVPAHERLSWHREQAGVGDDVGQRFHATRVVELLSDSIAVEPGSADLIRERVQWLGRLERGDEALADWSRLITLEPDDSGYRLGRAEQLRKLGRVDEALAGYDEVIRTINDEQKLRLRRGLYLGELGRFEEALPDMVAGLNFEIGHNQETWELARSNYQLAHLALMAGETEEYMSACRRAVRLAERGGFADDSAEAWNTLFFAIWTCVLHPNSGTTSPIAWDSLSGRIGRFSRPDGSLLEAAILIRRGNSEKAVEALDELELPPFVELLRALALVDGGDLPAATVSVQVASEAIRTWEERRTKPHVNSSFFRSRWPGDIQNAKILLAECEHRLDLS